MSATSTVSGLGSSLDKTLETLELKAGSASLEEIATELAGPLITVDLLVDGETEPSVVLAVRDDLGEDSELLLDALANAVADGTSISGAPPVGTLTDLLDRFSVPTTSLRVQKDSETVAVIVTRGDRRGEPAAPNQSLQDPSGSTTNNSPGGGNNALPNSTMSAGLDMLRNVELTVSVELGRTAMTLSDVVSLDIGSVIELDRATGSPVDVRVNGTLLARGEVVVVDDEYAVRVTEIIDPAQENN